MLTVQQQQKGFVPAQQQPPPQQLPQNQTPIFKAAHLNNKATWKFQNGDFAAAVVTLSQAMFSLKKAQLNVNSSSHSVSSSSSSSLHATTKRTSVLPFQLVSSPSLKRPKRFFNDQSSSSSSSSTMLSSLSSSTIETATATRAAIMSRRQAQRHAFFCSDNGEVSSFSWYLHQDAIRVEMQQHHKHFQDNGSFSDDEALDLLTYAIIYNLALCHHLDEIETQDDTKLSRAIIFYTHAQQLLGNSNDCCNDNYYYYYYSLAIANNLGHVYWCLDDENDNDNSSLAKKTKTCLERVLHTILYLSTTDTTTMTTTTSTSQETFLTQYDSRVMQGFLFNVINILVGSSLPAAAA